MKREYTTEIENKIKEIISYSYSNGLDQDTLQEMQKDIDINCEEYINLQYDILDREEICEFQSGRACESLHKLFEEIRDYDDSSAQSISKSRDEYFDSFISAFGKMVNICNTDWVGDNPSEIRMNQQYRFSDYNSSIYGKKEDFKEKIDKLPKSEFEELCESLYTSNPNNIPRLYEYLKKDPSELSAQELRAIISVFDKCVIPHIVIVDGVTKVDYRIDVEQLKILMTGMYYECDDSGYEEYPLYLYYKKSGMLNFLTDYYTAQYYLKKNCGEESSKAVRHYGMLSAILQSVNKNNEEIIEVPVNVNYTHDVKFHIEGNDVGMGDINNNKCTVYYSFDIYETDKIYVTVTDDSCNYSNVISEQFKGEKKTTDVVIYEYCFGAFKGDVRKHEKNGVTFFVEAYEDLNRSKGFGIVGNCADKIVGLANAIRKNKINNIKLDKQIKIEKLNSYSDYLGVELYISLCDDNIMIMNAAPNYNRLSVSVAYVNQICLEKGNGITFSENLLLEAYYAYLNDEETEEQVEYLDKFESYYKVGGDVYDNIDSLKIEVGKYLGEKDIYNVPYEKLIEALDYVRSQHEIEK